MYSIQSSHADSHAAILAGTTRDWLKAMRGFERCGFKIAQHHRATDFFLFRKDGMGLRFSIMMVDLAERLEVGVIHVEEAKGRYRPESEVALPRELADELSVDRLVLCTEYGDIDSGLILRAKCGSEIIIVSGAYPFTVEVKMTPPLSGLERFEPEYGIDRYERKPMRNAPIDLRQSGQ